MYGSRSKLSSRSRISQTSSPWTMVLRRSTLCRTSAMMSSCRCMYSLMYFEACERAYTDILHSFYYLKDHFDYKSSTARGKKYCACIVYYSLLDMSYSALNTSAHRCGIWQTVYADILIGIYSRLIAATLLCIRADKILGEVSYCLMF